ncbi:hypothetical protein C8Q75DRAFT_155053 [Abortiporus biennis]|nr:hypothetical protein C8Q75DRAFT_155053 [Abortiporus biennis]
MSAQSSKYILNCTVTLLYVLQHLFVAVMWLFPVENKFSVPSPREIGQPLSEYLHSYDLIWLTLCAFIAWTRAYILHRDVSATNIVIVEEGGDKPTQLHQHGTWMFMSALMQKFPNKEYELSDHLESFIHILNFFALRFHRHDITHPSLLSHTCTTFTKLLR